MSFGVFAGLGSICRSTRDRVAAHVTVYPKQGTQKGHVPTIIRADDNQPARSVAFELWSCEAKELRTMWVDTGGWSGERTHMDEKEYIRVGI